MVQLKTLPFQTLASSSADSAAAAQGDAFLLPLVSPTKQTALRLLKRKLGMRTLLDVISLKDTQLVRGSHGRLTDVDEDGPLVISSRADLCYDRGYIPAISRPYVSPVLARFY